MGERHTMHAHPAQATNVTTFKCEGCGIRKPAEVRYVPPGLDHHTACSEACYIKVHTANLSHLLAAIFDDPRVQQQLQERVNTSLRFFSLLLALGLMLLLTCTGCLSRPAAYDAQLYTGLLTLHKETVSPLRQIAYRGDVSMQTYLERLPWYETCQTSLDSLELQAEVVS